MAASTPVSIAPRGEFPSELKEQAQAFHKALKDVQDALRPLLSKSQAEVAEQLSPLDKARLDLSLLYTLNSLYWIYLCTAGEDPKQHTVRRELERVKEYMNRAKQIADKAKAPKVDAEAAQRFVRSSLWMPAPRAEDAKRGSAAEPPRKRRR